MNTPKFSMSYGAPSVPSAPMGAIGVVTNVEAVSKPKKAGGFYTVNIATLDTGVTVDFGFKPCPARIGDNVSWVVQKSYGANKFVAADPSAGSLPPAGVSAPRYTPAAPVSSASGTSAPSHLPPAYRAAAGKPFPLPRDHGDTAIIRQNSLTNAVKALEIWTSDKESGYFKTVEEMEQRIIQTAYKFASFSSGQLDAMLADDIANSTKGK